MLDAKLYCVFFLIFYSLYKKKSFYTLPCCGQQAMGLLSTFYCASLRFLCCIFSFSFRRETSLSNLSVKYWLKHIFCTRFFVCFASLMYTNWWIWNQKQSCTLYTWSAFVSQSVCRWFFGFIAVVNQFCCWVVLLFWTCHYLSQFVFF